MANATRRLIRKLRIIKNAATSFPRTADPHSGRNRGIQASAEINTAVLDAVAAAIHEGMSTEEIDKIVDETTTARGAICAPLNYEAIRKASAPPSTTRSAMVFPATGGS